jgi:hypothetical protein
VALPGVHVNVTITGELFQPPAFGIGDTDAAMTGGPDVTVTFELKVSPLANSEIVVVPLATPVTKPEEPTVAMFVAEEPQEAMDVISCEVPSEYLPSAVNCWLVPTGKNAVPGEIAALTNVGAVTVRVAAPVNVDRVAVIVVVP